MRQVLLKYLFLLVGFVLLEPNSGQSQQQSVRDASGKDSELIPPMEVNALRFSLEKDVLDIVQLESKSIAPESLQKVIAAVTRLEIDRKAFQADRDRFRSKEILRVSKKNALFAKEARQFLIKMQGDRRLPSTTKKGNISGKAAVKAPRFGSLNIDMSATDISAITASADAGDRPVSLQLSLPSLVPEKFKYDLKDYIRDIAIDIEVPFSVGEDNFTRIRKKVVSRLRLGTLKGFDPSAISIKLLPQPNTPGLGDWFSRLLDSNNPAIPLILVGTLLCLFIFLSSRLMAKCFAEIAQGLRDMKPSEDAAQGPDDIAPVVVEAAALESQTDISDDEAMASANMLTAEMKTIRDQLSDLIAADPETAANLILDLFYEQRGISSLRDLIVFVGYENLRPAMDLMPHALLMKLRNYIEDAPNEVTNFKSGCEVALRIYSAVVSRITLSKDASVEVDNFKKCLVQADDRAILSVVAGASSEELALIIMGLNVERGNIIAANAPLAVLKEATEFMDRPMRDFLRNMPILIQKITTFSENLEPISENQLRFILRMVRACSYATEKDIMKLLDHDDWLTKREVLNIRMFVDNLNFVNANLLKEVLDAQPLQERASILFLLDSEVKNLILGEYRDGSKVKDMITNELDLVESTESRREASEKNRSLLLSDFAEQVRIRLTRDPSLVESFFQKEADNLGVVYGVDSGKDISEPERAS